MAPGGSAEQSGKPWARPGVQHPGETGRAAPPDPCLPWGAGLWAGWRGSPLTSGGDRGDRGQHHGHVWAPCRDHICHFLGSWHPPLMKRECHRVWAREGPSVGRGRRQPCHRRGQAAALPKALASPSCTRLPGPPPGPGPLTRTTQGHTPPAPASGSGTGVSHEETNQRRQVGADLRRPPAPCHLWGPRAPSQGTTDPQSPARAPNTHTSFRRTRPSLGRPLPNLCLPPPGSHGAAPRPQTAW